VTGMIYLLFVRLGVMPDLRALTQLTRGEVYTEGRSVTVKGGSFTDRFDRWAVHVYRFSPTAR